MRIWENIKIVSYKMATIGGLGKWKLGSLIASFVAFPLVLALYAIAKINGAILNWTLLIGMILFLIFIHFALRFDTENARGAIVLDKIMGLMVAFWMVPFRWRIMIFGFILFHLLNNMKILTYHKITDKLEKIPGVLGVVIPDIISGLLVNIFLQLMIWALG